MHKGLCCAWTIFSLIGFSFLAFANESDFPSQNPNIPAIEVMFYNVNNLFDAKHDQGKEDWTFLPAGYPGKEEYCESLTNSYYKEECKKSDWTEKHVELKVSQIAKAIKSVRETLPDLLGVCEVENPIVVDKLAKKVGFKKFVMTNSPDERGIDVALLYNEKAGLKFERFFEHRMKGASTDANPTRNILEVNFSVSGGEKLSVFINHWPSQAAPANVRVDVAKQLQRILDQRSSEDPKANILIMGDFNTVSEDYPHPFKSVLLSANAKLPLYDVHELFFRNQRVQQNLKNLTPLGSYFYFPRMAWERLDRIFVNKNLLSKGGLNVKEETYKILHSDTIAKTFVYENPQYFGRGSSIAQTPYRANINTLKPGEAGFSDHFPVQVSLVGSEK